MKRFNSQFNADTARISRGPCCDLHWCQHLKDDLVHAVVIAVGPENLSHEEKERLRGTLDSGRVVEIFKGCQYNAHQAARSQNSTYLKKWLDETVSFSTGCGSVINLSGGMSDLLDKDLFYFASEDDEEKELGATWAEVGEHIWGGLAKFTRGLGQRINP